MAIKLKKLSAQVVVITGATSGIGLTTARMAAQEGATLVLAARNGDALSGLADELRGQGTKVDTVVADVGNKDDVARIGQAAIDRFGRIDSWLNNAGVSIYGRAEDVSQDDMERLFQTNFWGVVNGSLEAVRRMRGQGGALINLGSELSDCAAPLQSMYSASKHAVKGFTDSLRMELANDDVPISVTLIKPAGIDTMFTVHAKNLMDQEPELPGPLYAPEVVAKAILTAMRTPQRDVYIGAAARLMALGATHAPGLLDKIMGAAMFSGQKKGYPSAPQREDALHAPTRRELQQREGGRNSRVSETSLYTALSLQRKPLTLALLCGGAAFAAWKLSRNASARRAGQPSRHG